MIGVLGGGFGLYCHLAALSGLGKEVSTLNSYREKLASLPEGTSVLKKTSFFETERELVNNSSIVTIARRPQDHESFVRNFLAWDETNNVRLLVVEKPIATNPANAFFLFNSLMAKGVSVLTPFLFPYSNWAKYLDDFDSEVIKFVWSMPKRNKYTSWKYDVAQGGGLLNYYLINMVPIVAKCFQNRKVSIEVIDYADQHASIKFYDEKIKFYVNFCLAKSHRFSVELNNKEVHNSLGPFDTEIVPGIKDPRIKEMGLFYKKEVFSEYYNSKGNMLKSLELWNSIYNEINS